MGRELPGSASDGITTDDGRIARDEEAPLLFWNGRSGGMIHRVRDANRQHARKTNNQQKREKEREREKMVAVTASPCQACLPRRTVSVERSNSRCSTAEPTRHVLHHGPRLPANREQTVSTLDHSKSIGLLRCVLRAYRDETRPDSGPGPVWSVSSVDRCPKERRWGRGE